MMIAKVINRDPFISDCARWETNERSKDSRILENSDMCRVSARSLRLLLTTTGLPVSTVQRTHGTRTSTMVTRTTTIRTIVTMFALFGGQFKCLSVI